MRKYTLLVCLLASSILIGACSSSEGNGSQYVTVPHAEEFSMLVIQGVDENGAASSLTGKTITDADKIASFIASVESIEVTAPPSKELYRGLMN